MHNEKLLIDLLHSSDLDCLVFAESQNESAIHFLSFRRFASVQILVMGSPVTSGSPSIDYYLSGDLLEHPFRTYLSGDQLVKEHYTEQVVLFNGQAISYPQSQEFELMNTTIPAIIEIENAFKEQGGKSNVYMCFQSVFKLHPIFDNIIIKILFLDPNAIIILQSPSNVNLKQKIKSRIRKAIQNFKCFNGTMKCNLNLETIWKRILFIERVPSDLVPQILHKAHVILQPFPFDGSRTAFIAIEAGIPVITFPMEYLRGRMTANFLSSLDIEDFDDDPEVSTDICCIAKSPSDYIAKALRMGIDDIYREKISKAFVARRDRLYRQETHINIATEWKRFLLRAIVGITKEDIFSNDTWTTFLKDKYFSSSSLEEDLDEDVIMEQHRWHRRSFHFEAEHQ